MIHLPKQTKRSIWNWMFETSKKSQLQGSVEFYSVLLYKYTYIVHCHQC